MSTPSLHSASVATSVPSTSTIASRKKSAGCCDVDPQPGGIDGLHQVDDVGFVEPPAEVPFGGGVGDAHGAEGIEIDLVVAAQLDVLEMSAAGEDVEGDVQDMVGFVIGEMALEEMELGVDGGDQAGAPCQQEHGADAAGGEAVDALAEFVVDVAGGDHGDIAFGFGAIGDAVEDPPPPSLQELLVASVGLGALASGGLPRDNDHHSKPSVAWKNADPIPIYILPRSRGFFECFPGFRPGLTIYHACLGSRGCCGVSDC